MIWDKFIFQKDAQSDKEEGRDSTEPGKLPYWRCQPYIRPEYVQQSNIFTNSTGEPKANQNFQCWMIFGYVAV